MIALPIIASILLVITQVLDYHSTMKFLSIGIKEGNQRLRELFEKYGAKKVMIIKGLLHYILIPFLFIMPPVASIGVMPFLVYYYRVIKSNYDIYNKYK